LTAARFAGPNYRLARPLAASSRPYRTGITRSSSQYAILSRGPNPQMSITINLVVPEASATSYQTMELEAKAELVGLKGGRVQVPVKTEQFAKDEITVRNFILDTAQRWLKGAEPYSVYRVGGKFSFYFSSDPARSLAALLDQFVQSGSRDWHNSGLVFLFYDEATGRDARQLEIFDAWTVNRVSELDQHSAVIDPAALADQAMTSENRLVAQINRLNDQRKAWEMPLLPKHPSFDEIETAVKSLRTTVKRWPSLAEVAEKLAVESQALRLALEQYNHERSSRNKEPLFLA
jgi:hypothetical protein